MTKLLTIMPTAKSVLKIAFSSCLVFTMALYAEPKINLFTATDVGRIENGIDYAKDYDTEGKFLLRNIVKINL